MCTGKATAHGKFSTAYWVTADMTWGRYGLSVAFGERLPSAGLFAKKAVRQTASAFSGTIKAAYDSRISDDALGRGANVLEHVEVTDRFLPVFEAAPSGPLGPIVATAASSLYGIAIDPHRLDSYFDVYMYDNAWETGGVFKPMSTKQTWDSTGSYLRLLYVAKAQGKDKGRRGSVAPEVPALALSASRASATITVPVVLERSGREATVRAIVDRDTTYARLVADVLEAVKEVADDDERVCASRPADYVKLYVSGAEKSIRSSDRVHPHAKISVVISGSCAVSAVYVHGTNAAGAAQVVQVPVTVRTTTRDLAAAAAAKLGRSTDLSGLVFVTPKRVEVPLGDTKVVALFPEGKSYTPELDHKLLLTRPGAALMAGGGRGPRHWYGSRHA